MSPLLLALVFAGGVLTILSPCILPVLPFVFTRSDRRFATNGLPMLAGMAVSFAAVASLAAVGGAWAVSLSAYGRVLSLGLLALFAATLLSRRLAERLSRPFVALGDRLLPASIPAGREGTLPSLLVGVATGLLWAPCAGPILGLVLTGAALSGPTARTSLLLLAYAAGAATSLAVALLAGGRLFAALKRSLGAGEWIRRGLGVAALLAVLGIALGWDSGVLTRASLASTTSLEQRLLEHLGDASTHAGEARAVPSAAASPPGAGAGDMAGSAAGGEAALQVEGLLPSLAGASAWINSPPLSAESLRGKVVLVDFWTYSCINCLRALPYVKAWYDRYKDHGLIVIGVHAPEFAFERDLGNVERAVSKLGIRYPIALDDRYAIWRGFNNEYWPAHYFIDAEGRIRAHHFGEGEYEQSERTVRALLVEAGYTDLPPEIAPAPGSGIEAAADLEHVGSEETYLGYRRADRFSSPGGFAPERAKTYALPRRLDLNQWALAGRWKDERERAVLESAPGSIAYRFAARDLHLVLASAGGRPVRFRVRLDDAPPGASHGVDTDEQGYGEVREQRLYQLIRQRGPVAPHTFTIEFLDGGVEAYSFTFG